MRVNKISRDRGKHKEKKQERKEKEKDNQKMNMPLINLIATDLDSRRNVTNNKKTHMFTIAYKQANIVNIGRKRP